MTESPDRKKMYKIPWSKFDNQAGWVEVTDECNLSCNGCYRNRITGDRSFESVCDEIIECQKKTHCDTMVVSGGEPLLYPNIVELIRFIKEKKLKPLILSNGALLTPSLAKELKSAGLSRIHFHVDSRQNREGWEGVDEKGLNELRGHYANMLYDLKGIQCGFHVTVARENIEQVPAIIEWHSTNKHKVQHLSLIAFRAINQNDEYDFYANNKIIPAENMINTYAGLDTSEITSGEIYQKIQQYFPEFIPCAYINGDAFPETNKYLFFLQIGSAKNSYGFLGAKTMELSQVFYHLFNRKYLSFVKNPAIGKIIFASALFDLQVWRALKSFHRLLLKNPSVLFKKTYLQSIIIQQPIEFIDGVKNICDHCINPMVLGDKLINPCQLDEYRIFGGPIKAIKKYNR